MHQRARVLTVSLLKAPCIHQRVQLRCQSTHKLWTSLPSAGLLEGKAAATHWRASDQLGALLRTSKSTRAPSTCAMAPTWTSAGVATGIDMALAMLEEDLGRGATDSVAAELVLYARRPGKLANMSAANWSVDSCGKHGIRSVHTQRFHKATDSNHALGPCAKHHRARFRHNGTRPRLGR